MSDNVGEQGLSYADYHDVLRILLPCWYGVSAEAECLQHYCSPYYAF
jgi:hypothetical protein